MLIVRPWFSTRCDRPQRSQFSFLAEAARSSHSGSFIFVFFSFVPAFLGVVFVKTPPRLLSNLDISFKLDRPDIHSHQSSRLSGHLLSFRFREAESDFVMHR